MAENSKKNWPIEHDKLLSDYFVQSQGADLTPEKVLEFASSTNRTPKAITSRYSTLKAVGKVLLQSEIESSNTLAESRLQKGQTIGGGTGKVFEPSPIVEEKKVIGWTKDGATLFDEPTSFTRLFVIRTQGKLAYDYLNEAISTQREYDHHYKTAIMFSTAAARREYTQREVKVTGNLPLTDLKIGDVIVLDRLIGIFKQRKLLPIILFGETNELNERYFTWHKTIEDE